MEERFWEKVDRSGDCWVWTAAKKPEPRPYGFFAVDGRNKLAHRHAYEMAYGPIPDGLCVLHRCDNPPCVRPAHLFLGTNRDNTQDMLAKGRFTPASGLTHGSITKPAALAHGEMLPQTKLTPDLVRDIRQRVAQGESMCSLAKAHGVHRVTIRQIITGQSWKWVA